MVLDKGINHIYIKPATPRLNGKVERSHRIDDEEFYRMLKGVVIDDTGLFNQRLKEWQDYYNYRKYSVNPVSVIARHKVPWQSLTSLKREIPRFTRNDTSCQIASPELRLAMTGTTSFTEYLHLLSGISKL